MDANLLQRQRAYKAEKLLREMFDTWERENRDQHRLSAWKAIRAASRQCFRLEAPEEYERWGCVEGNEQRFVIPLDYLMNAAQRDLTAAVHTQLKDSPALSMALPLVGAGVIQAGANVIFGATMDQVHPFVDDKPPATWLANEAASVGLDSTMTVGQHTAAIKRAGIAVRVSRLLQLQSDIETRIDPLLTQLGNDLIDYGALQGAGTEEPIGAMTNTDIPATNGATMNMPGLAAMEASVVAADADDRNLTWFAGTTTRQTLRVRELSTGSGSIWPERDLLGHAAITTSKMPSDGLLLGDFRNMDIVLFGNGIEILVDPFANFKDGRVVFQLAVGMDVVVNYPGAFAKSTVT